MKNIQTCLFILLFPHLCIGQIIGNGLDDEQFALNVKTLDEFIERFNNENTTLIKSYLLEQGVKEEEISREKLLYSLFDRRNNSINSLETKEFIEFVESNEIKINFYDPNWYAEIKCIFKLNGEETIVKFILNVEKVNKNASKWVVNSAYAPFLHSNENFVVRKDFISPANHGTGFVYFADKLKNNNSLRPLLSSEKKIDDLSSVNSLLENGNLQFIRIDHIRYHLLQISNWIVVVENNKSGSNNSGWLISQLIKSNSFEKSRYKTKTLNL